MSTKYSIGQTTTAFEDNKVEILGPLGFVIAEAHGATIQIAQDRARGIIRAIDAYREEVFNEARPELGEHSHVEWAGFIIKRKMDFHPGEGKEGYIVLFKNISIMPGGTWFRSVNDAKKGIAAYKLACKIAPMPEGIKDVPNCEGETFWMIMELCRRPE